MSAALTRLTHAGALGLLLAVGLLLLAVPGESAYWVTSLQLSQEDGGVIATIEATAPVSYSYFTMGESEPRLVVDLSDAVHDLPRYRYSIEGSGSIKGIRTSQYRPYPQPSTRIVVDMTEMIPFQISTVDHRLIITLEDTPGARVSPAQPAGKPKEIISDQAGDLGAAVKQQDVPQGKTRPEPPAEIQSEVKILSHPVVSAKAEPEKKASTAGSVPAKERIEVNAKTVPDSTLPAEGDSASENESVRPAARPFTMGIREPVSYGSGGRRDPFAPLPAGQDVEFGQPPLADVEKLSIVGILWDVDGYRALAQDEDRNAYVFRKNDPVLYGYVARIEEERVIFRLNKRGLDRTIILKLPQ